MSPPTFKVMVNGECRPVLGGNPTVNLDPLFVDAADFHLLDLTSSTLQPLDVEYSKGSSLLLDQGITDATCDQIENPADSLHIAINWDCNSQLQGDCDHYLQNGWRHPVRPVFAQYGTNAQGNPVYALFDSRVQLDTNTITNPMMDGGGNKVISSTFSAETSIFDDTPRPAYYCSNAQQDIFNEEGCYLSFDPNVCTSFDMAVMKAITFDDNTLQNIFSLTNRYVYAIEGT